MTDNVEPSQGARRVPISGPNEYRTVSYVLTGVSCVLGGVSFLNTTFYNLTTFYNSLDRIRKIGRDYLEKLGDRETRTTRGFRPSSGPDGTFRRRLPANHRESGRVTHSVILGIVNGTGSTI